VLILRQKTVEGLLTIVIIVEEMHCMLVSLGNMRSSGIRVSSGSAGRYGEAILVISASDASGACRRTSVARRRP
jgi:hypothetical protein